MNIHAKTWFFLCAVGIFISSCQRNSTAIIPTLGFAWPESTPEDQGLDPKILAQSNSEADKLGFVNSLLIVKNGCLVRESYYNGFGKNDAHNVRSVSKSVLSALVGIALRDNFLTSTDQQMMSFFPQYSSLNIENKKYDLTINDLLTMRGGFDSDREILFMIFNSGNWIKTLLEWPLKYNPGEKFCYSTPATHLISAILTKATGMTTLQFAQTHLFEPLGINIRDWQRDPQGIYFGGSEMHFCPRDLARFGYLYLKDGVLDGEQILLPKWIQTSRTDTVNKVGWTWGDLTEIGYGYLWWLGKLGTHRIFFALGHGGQYIICVPDAHMIIVTTSNSNLDWDEADKQERAVLKVVNNFILPAVIN